MNFLRLCHKPSPLRNRILFLSLLTATLILGLSFATLYSQSMSTLMSQYQQTTVNLLTQAGSKAQLLFSNVESEAVQLQFNNSLQALFSMDNKNRLEQVHLTSDFLQSMRNYLSQQRTISAVIIMDGSGNVWGTSQKRTLFYDNGGLWKQYYPTLRLAFQSKWLGGYMDTDFALVPENEYYDSNGTEVLLCVRCINNDSGLEKGGIIIMALPNKMILDLFSDFAMPYDNICVVDQQGIQLCGTDDKLNGTLIAANTQSESSFYTNEQGVSMHVINISLGNRLRLVSMVPMTYYQNRMRPILYVMVIIGIVTLLVLSVCCVAASFFLEMPLKAMVDVIDQVGHGELEVRMDETPSILEYQKISRGFNRMLINIRALMDKNVEVEREKREAEIESLQAQINPHFLFNTITSIRWIAVMTHVDSIAAALTSLSKLLRPLFYNTNNVWTIREECEFIENYISLMELRFGSQVDFNMYTQQEALPHSIPRFILQPILENSYEHAGGTQRHTMISLNIAIEQRIITILIQDDGHGMDDDQLLQIRVAMRLGIRSISRSGSIGLVNVYRRLKLYYGDMVDMSIDSQLDNGVKVTIRIDESPSTDSVE